MGDNHDDQHVLNVEAEQQEIDKLIQSLLQFKPKSNREVDSSVSSAQTPKSVPRTTRARPAATKSRVSAGSPSPSASNSETSLDSLRDLFIDCLNKVNNQNKFLLKRVSALESLVSDQKQTIDGIKEKLIDSSTTSDGDREPNIPSAEPHSPTQLINVVERVQKIESRINSCQLLCRGPVIASKIAAATVNRTPNLGKLKAELCMEIFGRNVSQISVNSFDVSVFGKHKNLLKIECLNLSTKEIILNQARLQKPKGIYVVEYLSSDKLPVYHSLLRLKRERPDVVKAVYTRRGIIFGKIGPEDSIASFGSLQDVGAIHLPDRMSATTPPPPPLPHSPRPDRTSASSGSTNGPPESAV